MPKPPPVPRMCYHCYGDNLVVTDEFNSVTCQGCGAKMSTINADNLHWWPWTDHVPGEVHVRSDIDELCEVIHA